MKKKKEVQHKKFYLRLGCFKELFLAWLLLMFFVTVDLLTTVIGLNLGGSEMNPILVEFLNKFGQNGYILQWLWIGLMFMVFLIVINFVVSLTYLIISKKYIEDKFILFIFALGVSAYGIFDTITIASNLRVIMSFIFG